jgi:hypothetical protein
VTFDVGLRDERGAAAPAGVDGFMYCVRDMVQPDRLGYPSALVTLRNHTVC